MAKIKKIKAIYRWICIEVFQQMSVQRSFYIIISGYNSLDFESEGCNFAGNCMWLALQGMWGWDDQEKNISHRLEQEQFKVISENHYVYLSNSFRQA